MPMYIENYKKFDRYRAATQFFCACPAFSGFSVYIQ